jgi:hypothetical protein
MPHYKLHRCKICKKFSANMMSESGDGYLCYKCWYTRYKAEHPVIKEDTPNKAAPDPGQSLE